MSERKIEFTWLVLLGLVTALVSSPVFAGQPKKGDKKGSFDAAAEEKQSAMEDEQDVADRKNGIKKQKVFHGTFMLAVDGDKNDDVSPEVIGQLVTDAADKTPGRAFFVKVENKKADVIEALKRANGKKVSAEGKLRNLDKYLIVSAITEAAQSAPPKERGGRGGL